MGNNTFDLNRDFALKLAELYHDDQVQAFRVLNEDAMKYPSRRRFYAAFKPFSKERVKRYMRRLLEVSFWASLLKEEGRHHQFAVVFCSPASYSYPEPDAVGLNRFVFKEPLPFDATTVAKLAPALESKEDIGVWPMTQRGEKGELGELGIWGCAAPLHESELKLNAIEPGQIMLSLGDYLKARITGLTAEFVDEHSARVLSDFCGKSRPVSQDDYLVGSHRRLDPAKIAFAMRAHGHGGTLLILANDNATWEKSIDMTQLRFAGQPYERAKRALAQRDKALQQFSANLHSSIDIARQSLDSIGQLTAADGATLVTCDLAVLGFGAKIKPMTPGRVPEAVWVLAPFEGSEPARRKLSEVFPGTRHQSAAQFVFDQEHEAMAIVASEDGRLSVFVWDEKEGLSVTPDAEWLLW